MRTVTFELRAIGRWFAMVFAFALGTVLGTNAMASSAPHDPIVSALCDRATVVASGRWGVPLDVMRAISLTETGRRAEGTVKPWPWTVNMEGKGIWFATPESAKAYVEKHFQRGARSFDVGCFQINYRWHGTAFSSINAMFDPGTNADYAARFLSELYEEFGDWGRAAGAYHSRSPELAQKYRSRFDRLRRMVMGDPPPANSTPVPTNQLASQSSDDPAEGSTAPRLNSFPLLRASGSSLGLGSLVPLGGSPSARPLVPAG